MPEKKNDKSIQTGRMSRKEFLKGAGLTISGVAVGSVTLPGAGAEKTIAKTAAKPIITTKPIWSFEVPPAPIPASSIKETAIADVVVLGAGIAGLAAAVSAAESGAKTVLLEKYKMSAAPGSSHGAINSKDQLAKGNKTDAEKLIKDLLIASEGRADQRLLRKWADNSGPVTDWMMDIAKIQGTRAIGMGNSYIFGGFGGSAIYDMLTNYGTKSGMQVRYDTQAVQLIRPESKGRVKGVVAKNKDGSYLQFSANKAVIICTGDYGNNPQMIAKYVSWAAYDIPNMYDIGTNTGEGLQMALWAGAAIEDEPHCAVIHFISTNAKPPRMYRPFGMGGMPLGIMPPGGALQSGAPGSGAMPGMMSSTGFSIGRKSFLYVNKSGERFTNETVAQEHLATIVLRQPGHTMWQILDAKAITSRNKASVDKALTTGEVLSGDTPEALAAKFGADPAKFKATVSRYNEIVKMGNDPDFGVAPQSLGDTLDTAPFYACESPPDLLVCMGGILTNTDMQVLDTNKDIIPGLYAAGNLTGGFWGDSYPMSVFPGLARGKALTFGRLAGLHAAKT